jgi:hypothetical protein
MEEKHEGQEKRIIVDEDWKARVQREREEHERAAAHQQQQQATAGAEAARRGPAAAGLPAPSLVPVVELLALQAAAHLEHGDFAGARFWIDTLGVLEAKTRQNLTGEERVSLENTLFGLRMAFVEAVKAAERATDKDRVQNGRPGQNR